METAITSNEPLMSNTLSFGHINVDLSGRSADLVDTNPQQFVGHNFQINAWDQIPGFILRHILDHYRMGILEEKIASIWKLVSVPTLEFIYNKLVICSDCNGIDHRVANCPNRVC